MTTNQEQDSLHAVLTRGIERALADLGADLVGAQPATLTGPIIQELRAAGLDRDETANPNTVTIHNHYSPEGEKQRRHVADVIRACRDDDWGDDAIASSVFVALLNPR